MRQVLIRAWALLRRPLALCGLLPVAIGGCALVPLPLFDQPGFELAFALTLAIGLFGGLVGLAAARLERQLIVGRDADRPRTALRFDGALTSAFAACVAAVLINLLALLPAFAFATARAAFSTRCDPFANFAFFPWLTLPSAVLAACAGVFCGLLTLRKRTALLAFALLVLASAVWTVWPIYFGPQFFAFNFFGGYFPGPLYDEALHLRPAIAWFRLETIGVAAALLGLTGLTLRMTDGLLTVPKPRPAALVLTAIAALGVASLELRATRLGLRSSDASVQERLGGHSESTHFVLTFPAEKERTWVDRTLRDLEFRYFEDKQFLGVDAPGKVHVFVYRSPQEKELLVGAGLTQFTKPWRGEIHVNDEPFPHRVVKHELVHAMAASLGKGPFKITTRFGIPMMGVVEGLAVAGDDPHEELTLHQWAAAMKHEHLLPDLRRILAPTGFYAQAASRAYTAAGSFLRYLADREGASKLQAVYAHGDFAKVYGRSVDALVTEWEKFLDTVPVSEGEIHRAFARFRVGSLFTRACAREVADLSERAAYALPSDPAEALSLYRRAGSLDPDEPTYVLGEAAALTRLTRLDEAEQVLAKYEPRLSEAPALLAQVQLARADLLARLEKPEVAKEELTHALALDPGPDLTRTAQVKLAALARPGAAQSAKAYFSPVNDELRLWGLERAVENAPGDPVVHYLLGRRLAQLQVGAPASAQLARALSLGLTPALTDESERLALFSEYLAGDCAAVQELAGHLSGPSEALRATANEWVLRCGFETTTYGSALVPEGPFR
jgi:tetratricopeptide (TPR) repeat protein